MSACPGFLIQACKSILESRFPQGRGTCLSPGSSASYIFVPGASLDEVQILTKSSHGTRSFGMLKKTLTVMDPLFPLVFPVFSSLDQTGYWNAAGIWVLWFIRFTFFALLLSLWRDHWPSLIVCLLSSSVRSNQQWCKDSQVPRVTCLFSLFVCWFVCLLTIPDC